MQAERNLERGYGRETCIDKAAARGSLGEAERPEHRSLRKSEGFLIGQSNFVFVEHWYNFSLKCLAKFTSELNWAPNFVFYFDFDNV